VPPNERDEIEFALAFVVVAAVVVEAVVATV
jgi:hypothetical protein